MPMGNCEPCRTLSDETREERIAWYRGCAADCRELAKTSPDECSRAMLEGMAAKWERLASLIECGELA